ncbi:hypothetical protein BC829DRAFT_389755 [Chytridium lagenaria]|nr:hypothetical protein BC829DRAFT_389755 [Chytridium lagenaria]
MTAKTPMTAPTIAAVESPKLFVLLFLPLSPLTSFEELVSNFFRLRLEGSSIGTMQHDCMGRLLQKSAFALDGNV